MKRTKEDSEHEESHLPELLVNHGARDDERVDHGHLIAVELDVERDGHLESDGEVKARHDEKQQAETDRHEFDDKDEVDGQCDEEGGNQVEEADGERRVGGADEIATNRKETRVPEK